MKHILFLIFLSVSSLCVASDYSTPITKTRLNAIDNIINPHKYDIDPDNALDKSLSDEEKEYIRSLKEWAINMNYASGHGDFGNVPLPEGVLEPTLSGTDAGKSRYDKGLHIGASQEDINRERAFNDPGAPIFFIILALSILFFVAIYRRMTKENSKEAKL